MKNQNLLFGDVFIIPNPAFSNKKDSSFKLPSFMDELNKVFYSNSDLNEEKISFDDTRFIECWFCNPDNDNWRDHGITGLEDGIDGDSWRLSTAWIPEWIFANKKEGDGVTLTLPVQRRDENRGVCETSMVIASVILAQTKYRYRNFGTFEEVLKRV